MKSFISLQNKYPVSFTAMLLLVVCLCFSCKRSLQEEKLLEYINDEKHGLIEQKLINGVQLKMVYKPSDLLAWQEIKVTDSITKEKAGEIRARYAKQYYFLLSVSLQGREILSSAVDREWFSNMVNTLSFGMNDYVSLVTESLDTLKLITYQCPRTYGMSAGTDVLFVFEKKQLKPNENLTLKINEFGLYTGDVRFKTKVRNIKKAPKLKDINKLD
ncbi:MAG: hypothetical protein JXB00_19625 [Bacteroidales bacterium]|nr:hypothetical protein [Bacteroidales bacterium]